MLGLLCLGNAVVRLLHLLGEFGVVDDDLAHLEAVAGDSRRQVVENRTLDGVTVFVQLFERHQRSLGLHFVADECLDGLLGLIDHVDRILSLAGDHLEDDRDRKLDHLIVLGLDVARHADLEQLQVHAVGDLLDEWDDQVESGLHGAVVATESLDHAHFLLVDDLDRHHHEDDEDDDQRQQEEVGEDAGEKIADVVEQRLVGRTELGAVLLVGLAVHVDALFVRHVVKTSR